MPSSPPSMPSAPGLGAAPLASSAAASVAAAEDGDVDPLDAFMASEVMPEVKEKLAEEAKKKEAERHKHAEALAKGKPLPSLKVLEDSDSEEEPDLEIQIPKSKVKLVVGPNGTMIGTIQRKSKARVQIKRDEEELNRAWGSGPTLPPKLPPHVRQQMQKQQAAAAKAAKEGRLLQGAPGQQPAAATNPSDKEKAEVNEEKNGSEDEDKPGDAPRPMTTIMIFGDQKAVEIAERMVWEAVENKEQKAKQREKQYDKKREEKRRARLLYYMRHTKDYEALELQPGSSKADVKKAYRKLAMKWHPDKHPDNMEEAKAKFQVIQKAYDNLMSTDEEEIQMQITAGAPPR